MKTNRIRFHFFCILGLLMAQAFSQEPTPPASPYPSPCQVHVGVATIHTAPSVNHEVIAKASKGEILLAREEKYGWIGVDLPLWATVWVHESLVSVEGRSQGAPAQGQEAGQPKPVDFLAFGTIQGDRVNLRSRPNQECTTIGQVNSKVRVRVTGSCGEWVRINSLPGRRGWIKADMLEVLPSGTLAEAWRPLLEDPEILFVSGTVQEKGQVFNRQGDPVVALTKTSAEWVGQQMMFAGRYELGQDPSRPGVFNPSSSQAVPLPEEAP